MYITIESLTNFFSDGMTFNLPSEIVRYLEFEDVVVFLLNENGKRNKIIGVKFSQEGEINHHYIAWEFQIIDGLGKIYPIHYFVKKTHKEQELICCWGGGFDIDFYINPISGEIIDKVFTKC
ncbi:MAG: hypothetical protein LBN93_07105 [Candidatus Symbiothrix sp.]|jgi:hypothetical protein|nr:hypothetical protein [Candidatus Symbiothrix sp.]